MVRTYGVIRTYVARLLISNDLCYILLLVQGVSKGTWYFEVYIKDIPQPDCAVRLGWAQVYGKFGCVCLMLLQL